MNPIVNDTICALATPPGIGGLAVLRLSGPQAWAFAERLTEIRSNGKANTAHFARIFDSRRGESLDSPAMNELLDEVIVTFFQAPRSYTGEDVVEISCHGGRYAAGKILALLLQNGARMARPGEFTERAFLNGKLDLAQAEAVAELIHARTDRAGRAAARQLAGGLSQKVRGLRLRALDLLALLELELDFSDEDVEFQTRAARLSDLTALRGEIKELAATFALGRLVREGLRVAIVGAPNAGKSTLLNALAREDRAIVSAEPGTTRDVVESHIAAEGLEIILQDTAGLRTASGDIESQGIARTRQAMEQADVVLLVVDVSDPHWPDSATVELLQNRRVILVGNKMDLVGARPAVPAAHDFEFVAAVEISARHNMGIEDLLHNIIQIVLGEDVGAEEIVVAEARHHDCLVRAAECLSRASEQMAAPTFMASDLRDAVNALGEITGETVGEEILDRIFSQFCIGK